MPAKFLPCGEPVNQSERIAAQKFKTTLETLADPATWVIFTNLASSSPLRQSDDLDIVLIGPRGVFLVEVKHWDAAWIANNRLSAENEAEKLTSKTRRFAGRVERALFNRPKVHQVLLLTREPAGQPPQSLRGVPIWTLRDLSKSIRSFPLGVLNELQITSLATSIEPAAKVQLDGKVRRIAAYQNLELQTMPSDTFHRIYKGTHQRTKERVILHLYDLSATEQKNPERQAERDSRALQMLQQTRFVPRVRDTLRDLPEYPGELSYFTLIDPGAPTIAARMQDKSWSTQDRITFASACLDALNAIHTLSDPETGVIVHRNICPGTILVGSRNEPLFIDFSLARLPNTQTLGAIRAPDSEYDAPEVRQGGLTAATQLSDVYSLCASLLSLLAANDHQHAPPTREILQLGCSEAPAQRPSLIDLRAKLQALICPAVAPQPSLPFTIESDLPPSEYWCEGQLVPFRDMTLRVVSRLGAGGVGRTFKVEQVDPASGENFGTFVAKVMKSPDSGRAALQAYQRVRSHSASTGLSAVFETASEFRENRVVALLKWVEGDSLDTLAGVLPLAAEEAGDESVETLLLRWALDVCNSLAVLHSQGLVHGDVSPRNLIHHRGGLTLTDYDLVTPVGHPAWGVGATLYCSPEAQQRSPLQPADDVFALAAALFEVAFDRHAFPSPQGAIDKLHGLDWRKDERASLPKFAEFLDKATQAGPQQRFKDAREAVAFLNALVKPPLEPPAAKPLELPGPIHRVNQHIAWLDSLLRIYPGSPHGNAETRGLDSDFALATYVETPLEEALFAALKNRQTRLVILCGNAGDGKTALLQHLAAKFGVPTVSSALRVWEAQTQEGLVLRANLDGAAAWEGRSANELLDEFLHPFFDGPPASDIAHLLAINDGRLYEWIDTRERTASPSALTRALRSFLAHDDQDDQLPNHVQFINLNHRSLVGGRTPLQTWSSDFLDRLIDSLLGGDRAKTIWSPCNTCTAFDRCVAGPTAQLLLEHNGTPPMRSGQCLRQRIAEALQAVHQRGQVHITTRELRGVLSYVLFGVTTCAELHNDPGRRPWPLWDMLFDPASPHRQPPQQGVLLHELASLDPALDAHPQLDRWLMGRTAREVAGAGPSYPGLSRESARRRAYIEWTEEQVEAVTGTRDALNLAGGEHLRLFHDASLREPTANSELCAQLCRGISQLDSLPPPALARLGTVPLRISPRTPTETAFWVEKPLDRFRLEAEWPRLQTVPMPILPRQLRLVYRATSGREDVLLMGYELFHTLLSLASGEQLSELRSDDLFANLAIFTQRLVQEDEGHLLAWNPKTDATVFRLAIRRTAMGQILACESTALDPAAIPAQGQP